MASSFSKQIEHFVAHNHNVVCNSLLVKQHLIALYNTANVTQRGQNQTSLFWLDHYDATNGEPVFTTNSPIPISHLEEFLTFNDDLFNTDEGHNCFEKDDDQIYVVSCKATKNYLCEFGEWI